jgi:4-hydroxythreonine-4-phosphate dehydrogenase|tara:strand:+ start:17001 stop:17978 length:978 start_codon:yes stop_codon:yes gene_type:complete
VTSANTKPVLVTIGDPNGIGPEIAVKAAATLHEDPRYRPVLLGDDYIVAPLADALGFGLQTDRSKWGSTAKTIDLFVINAMPPANYVPGTVNAAAGRATVSYVEAALALLADGAGRGVIGCPHSETAVNASGRVFSGYPNLLSELLKTGPDSVFLMLVGGGLRVVHVTLHEGINSALRRLNSELIEKAALAADSALRDLGVAKPRVGVFGINPHAGENGLFGDEDNRIVAPAIQKLREQGVDAHGPEGADTMLARDGFDAYVAMYHDQGHIPVKLLAGRKASALSIGADTLFSSVGHGAAFDIAGKNCADPEAVIRAIKLVGGAK